MQVSIIIPALNEAENIERLVHQLKTHGGKFVDTIVVVDGGSTDDTAKLAEQAGATVLKSPQKGRAFQMNYGAQYVSGDLLYFVHADTFPPECYMKRIQKAVSENFPMGCFWFEFDSDRKIFKFQNYMTHLDKMWCRGGDQSLFVTRKVFEELNGYKNDYIIMEEYDFIGRARKKYPFKIIPKAVKVSARKYENNSYLRVMMANFIVFSMYRFGASQQTLAKTYRSLLN
jgi:rSAM/selenodomain-associated transferase 2